jgi:dolichol-phosphate mannosyltransferase
MKRVMTVVACLQAMFALRVLLRLLATAGGSRITPRATAASVEERVSVLVPVLNEESRLSPCLAGLVAQGPEVAEIVVIDGGSIDRTREIVAAFAARDARIRFVDAAPVPDDVNGKAYGLHIGATRAHPETNWVLTVDADVRPSPLLVRSLLWHAAQEEIALLSVATQQRLSGAAEGIIHPAMLATLVYRFGIPGHATSAINQVQANGQCFLIRRDVLDALGGFKSVLRSPCEDVTLARAAAAIGCRVGFSEADNLVSVEMYAGWRDTWDNWTRSLPMRDRFTSRSSMIGLIEITLVQALPLALMPWLSFICGRRHPATILNGSLLCMRFGVLAGMSRAYERRPITYWLSPLADLPVTLKIWQMSRRRRHRWRGRTFTTGVSQ